MLALPPSKKVQSSAL